MFKTKDIEFVGLNMSQSATDKTRKIATFSKYIFVFSAAKKDQTKFFFYSFLTGSHKISLCK